MLDVNDILDERLMPATFLLLEAVSNKTDVVKTVKDGSFINAYSTMGFHRKMINKYLCTSFVAEQILSDVVPQPIPAKLANRIGISKDDSDKNETRKIQQTPNNDVKETMLYDEGSSGYSNWLSKTTTLDDIYKHYSVRPRSFQKKTVPNRRIMDSTRQDLNDDDYEEGEITGFAVHQPMQTNIYNGQGNGMELGGGQFDNFGDYSAYNPHATAGSKTVDSSLRHLNPHAPLMFPYGPYFMPAADFNDNRHHDVVEEGYYQAPEQHQHQHQQQHSHSHGHGHGGYEVQEDDKGMTKEMELKDIFDIALTTLAFLSFGMFILQVLMCITMTKTDNNMMMMPMEDSEDVNGPEVRRKRSTSNSPSIVQINEITKKVLKSIDAVLIAEKDNGSCLHRTLCENNKFARNRTDGQNIWIPVWGLGLSWLSSKITSQPTSILESLKASTLGLGNADCLKLYSTCTK